MMPVDTRNLRTDGDQLGDDGSPPRHAFTATSRPPSRRTIPVRPRADARPPVAAVDKSNDEYRRLGASHRRRDESTRLTARAIEERDTARRLACHHRWPAIIDSMRTLIGCYNDGAGGDILSLGDGPTSQGVEPTVTVTARSGRTLVLAVEGPDLWVRAGQDENGRSRGERWIGLNRTDDAIAGCVLQSWLAQLEPCDSAVRAPVELARNEPGVTAGLKNKRNRK